MSLKFLPLILAILMIGCAIEFEMSAPSFVAISEYFHSSIKTTSFILTFNLIGFVIGAAISGPLSESYGRRKTLFYFGIIGLIGAIGCAFATSIGLLIFSRFVQGIGMASFSVIVPVIIADVYSISKATKLYRIIYGTSNIFTAAAPVFGGFIHDLIGWRGNFGTLVIIQIISLCILYLFLQETKQDSYSKFHIVKIIQDYKKLLKHKIYICTLIFSGLTTGIFFVIITYTPFLYIKTFKVSASIYSLHLTIFALIFPIASLIFHSVKTTRSSLYIGLIIILLGPTFMLFAHSIYFVTFCLCMLHAGWTLAITPILVYSLTIFPEMRGAASSMLTITRYSIPVLAVYLGSFIYNDSVFSIAIILLFLMVTSSLILIYLIKTKIFDNQIIS